jgi:hypothetical protein
MNPIRYIGRRILHGTIFRLFLFIAVAGQLVGGCVPRHKELPQVVPPVESRIEPEGPHLVAAGILKGDMVSRSKVQNDLRIIKVAGGQITVGFDGYRMPDKAGIPRYKVKASASQTGGMVVPMVALDSFTSEGIVLKVTDPDGKLSLPLKYMADQEFAIEIKEVPSP